MISILLADDHQVVLEGFKALLAHEESLRVVGEATDGAAVLSLASTLKPDVVVVDLMMPGMNGLEVARRLKQEAPSCRVIMLSMHDNIAYVAEAMRAGAGAYVLKQSPSRELLNAILAVSAGQRYLSPPLSVHALEDYETRSKGQPLEPFATLSAREREVFQLAAEGRTSAEIGERFGISRRTVESHRASILRKLHLKSQSELVRFAVERGLISS